MSLHIRVGRFGILMNGRPHVLRGLWIYDALGTFDLTVGLHLNWRPYFSVHL